MILILGEAPGPGRGVGRTRERFTELSGRPWEDWARWRNLLDVWPGEGSGNGSGWDAAAARESALLVDFCPGDLTLLLGRRVAAAVAPEHRALPWFETFEIGRERFAIFPHTSGINRFWNEAVNVEAARKFLACYTETR